MSVFEKIVSEVNKVYEYKTDKEQYGKEEWWADLKRIRGKLVGDCEDYCLTIANRSIKSGIPLSSLKLHLVATKRNKPDHMILECDGWFADCNTRGLMRTPPYQLISHRQLDEPRWHL